MRVYLDSCALHRLFDDRSQPRVRAEAEAVEKLFAMIRDRSVDWLSSEVLEAEVLGNKDFSLRAQVLNLMASSAERICVSGASYLRAETLERLGYGAFDALHLACAEQAAADFLLTTDDRFARKALRGDGSPSVRLENPVNWIKRYKP